MTQFSQGWRMNAGRAPYIEDMRVRTDAAGNQFLDAFELQTALNRTHGQVLRLHKVLCVVVLDASVHAPLVHFADSRRPPWQVALTSDLLVQVTCMPSGQGSFVAMWRRK